MSELVEFGLIEVEQRGLGKSNVYRFILDKDLISVVKERCDLSEVNLKKFNALIGDNSVTSRDDNSVTSRKDNSVTSRKDNSVTSRKDNSVTSYTIQETIDKNNVQETGDKGNSPKKNPFDVVSSGFKISGFDGPVAYKKIIFTGARGQDAQKLMEALKAFADYKTQMGKPMVEVQLVALRNSMSAYTVDFVVSCIEQTIAAGWQGINFERFAADEKKQKAFEARGKQLDQGKKGYWEKIKDTQAALENHYMQEAANDPDAHLTVQQIKEREYQKRLEAMRVKQLNERN